ncbi:MAG: hypothetical protein QM630_09815 [Microbacterium sp.]
MRDDEVTHGAQVLRFTLVDALNGDVLGTVDVARKEGVDAPPAVLAELTEAKATHLTVSTQVRGESTCNGCQPGEYSYDSPIWHTWRALLQFDVAG